MVCSYIPSSKHSGHFSTLTKQNQFSKKLPFLTESCTTITALSNNFSHATNVLSLPFYTLQLFFYILLCKIYDLHLRAKNKFRGLVSDL